MVVIAEDLLYKSGWTTERSWLLSCVSSLSAILTSSYIPQDIHSEVLLQAFLFAIPCFKHENLSHNLTSINLIWPFVACMVVSAQQCL